MKLSCTEFVAEIKTRVLGTAELTVSGSCLCTVQPPGRHSQRALDPDSLRDRVQSRPDHRIADGVQVPGTKHGNNAPENGIFRFSTDLSRVDQQQ